jgi:integrase
MIQAAQLRLRTGMRALTYSTLVGLLVATGLRTGEALRLDRSDVDLLNGILSVRESKFGKSRFVPVQGSTRLALEYYAQQRDKAYPLGFSEAFLVSERGNRLKASTVRSTFVRMSRAIGLRSTTEDGRDGYGPRLQDFRHSFATGRLVE